MFLSTKFKFNDHIDSILNRANRQLGLIARVFKQRNSKTIIPLYTSYVRPLLENNSIIWSPYTKLYVQKIERIQEKMCNLIGDLRSLTYQEKLRKLKLQSLRARRIKHQLIFMYKMKYKFIDLCFDDFFQENNFKKTRGNAFKLKFPISKTKFRKNFFACSIIKHWNVLKTSDINVRNTHLFKKKVDNYLNIAKIW